MKNKKHVVLALIVAGFTLAPRPSLGFGRLFQDPDPSPAPSNPQPAPAPAPTPQEPIREPAAGDIPAPVNIDIFRDVAYPVGEQVDSYYSSYRELLPLRNAQESHRTDNCDINLDKMDRFADRIGYMVGLKMQKSTARIEYVGDSYSLPTTASQIIPNSLISHPLCEVTSSSLNKTLGGKNIPSSATIQKANAFSQKMNEYRRAALAGDQDAYVKAEKLWSKMMMCLSYTESLTSADSRSSQNVASNYAPSGYRKPAGVNFYEDPYQDAASRLNIGLFQFTPSAGGNIQACIREWNTYYPNCSIRQNETQSEMIRTLGSSLQTFNAFCGTAKVTGMFAVQMNTRSSSFTHPANVTSNGLKNSDDRCVTPFFAWGKSYSHFGPFANSTGDNLAELMNCTMKDE